MCEDDIFIEDSINKIIDLKDDINIASCVTHEFNQNKKNMKNNRGSVNVIFIILAIIVAVLCGVLLGYFLAK